MAKYKVLQRFKDVYTKELYEENQVIEMSEKRAEEAIKNLKKYDGEFLERIDDKQDNKQQDNKPQEPKKEEKPKQEGKEEKQEGDE